VSNAGPMDNRGMHPQPGMPMPQLPDPTGGSGEGSEPQPLKLIHRIMRRYYVWAVVLGLVLGLPAAYAGYKLVPKEYTSTGQLVIETQPDRVLYEIQENQTLLGVGPFVAQQTELLRSRRVLERANKKLETAGIGWPVGNDGVVRLEESIRVEGARMAPIVYCAATDESAAVAEKAANAVLDSYRELYVDNTSDRARRYQLQQMVDSRTQSLRRIRAEINDLAREYGTDELGPIERQRSQDILNLSDEIENLRAARNRFASVEQNDPVERQAATEADATDAIEDDARAIESGRLPSDRVLEAMAADDDRLRTLLDRLNAFRDQRNQLAMNLGPAHRQMKINADRIAATEQELLARVLEIGLPDSVAELASSSPEQTLKNIDNEIERLVTRRRQLQDEQRVMRTIQDQIEERKVIEREQASLLEDARGEIERIDAELGSNRDFERVRVEEAPRPLAPSADKRNKIAAAGLAAGFGFSGMLFLGVGYLRLGYERISDLEELSPQAPTVGVMPDLDDPDAADETLADLSIHHLRNLLLVKRSGGPRACRVYAVTSPAPGDGKTTLVEHLAQSFAKIGHRTLAVDADMVGHRLSRHSGYGEEEGLWQALERGELQGFVHESETDGLFIMPTGAQHTAQPERLSGEQLGMLLAEFREDFDTVLIDTGPLLGSLDASLVTSGSDETLLVINRGRRTRLVKGAIERLRSLGVRQISLVFNRATWSDLGSSVTGVSLSGPSLRSVGPEDTRAKASNKSLKRRLRPSEGAAPRL